MAPYLRLPEPGETLLGKYALLRFLGKGGVGVVFEAEHLRLRQRVALKVLAPEMLAHPDMVERFEREARAMARLSSPFVTRVTDVDITPEGMPFLVMEFLQGNDLQQELKRRGALSIDEAVHWVRQACAGMAVVHAAGIVHRDLKPANLFLTEEAGVRTLKIMDFGISKILGDDVEMTSTIATLGTPAYMSPEQVRSAKNIDERADVWSLGVILHRSLTGKLPFAGQGSTGMAVSIVTDDPEPIESLRPDVPPELAAVLRRALSKDPGGRYTSVMAFSDALGAALSGQMTAPSGPPSTTSSIEYAPPPAAVLSAAASEPPEAATLVRSGSSLVGQSLIATPPKARTAIWPFALVGLLLLGGIAAAFVLRAPARQAAAGPSVEEPAAKPTAKPNPKPVETDESEVVAAPSVSAAPKPEPTVAEPVAPGPPKPVAPSTAKPAAPPTAKPAATAASPLPVLL